jgi:hypothetical protein
MVSIRICFESSSNAASELFESTDGWVDICYPVIPPRLFLCQFGDEGGEEVLGGGAGGGEVGF